MQNETPNYETRQQRAEHPHPDYAEHKLGSMRRDDDPVGAVAGTGPAGMPAEFIAAEIRPVARMPREGLPVETQPTDFMTVESRPRVSAARAVLRQRQLARSRPKRRTREPAVRPNQVVPEPCPRIASPGTPTIDADRRRGRPQFGDRANMFSQRALGRRQQLTDRSISLKYVVQPPTAPEYVVQRPKAPDVGQHDTSSEYAPVTFDDGHMAK